MLLIRSEMCSTADSQEVGEGRDQRLETVKLTSGGHTTSLSSCVMCDTVQCQTIRSLII